MLDPLPGEPFELTGDAQKLFDSISADVAQANAATAEAQSALASIRAIPASELTAAQVNDSRAAATRDFEAKRLTLAVLKRVHAEWLPTRASERQRAQQAAREAEAAAFASIKTKLVAIGYNPDTINRGAMILHPDVRAAVDLNAAMQSIDNYNTFRQFIEQKASELGRELETAKARLLTV